MDELGGLPLNLVGYASGWSIVALGVVMILRGKLIPWTYYQAMKDERDYYRETLRISQGTLTERSQQTLAATLDVGESVKSVLTAVQNILVEPPGRGEPK